MVCPLAKAVVIASGVGTDTVTLSNVTSRFGLPPPSRVPREDDGGGVLGSSLIFPSADADGLVDGGEPVIVILMAGPDPVSSAIRGGGGDRPGV